MDREEALALLKGGSAGILEWNRLREVGGEIPPLHYANFHEDDLAGADLSAVNLDWSMLAGAYLYETNFSGASLVGADLARSHLIKANLAGSQLYRTNFAQAYMTDADLTGSVCNSTSFSGLDLSQVRGLHQAVHRGPSTVGVDTLFLSDGRIPVAFLEGCGVPDSLIVNLPALIGSMTPIQFYTCFLSHSSTDKEFARRLHSRMRQEGLRVWFDEADMQSGKKLHDQIDEAIRVHERLLLVLSSASMDGESGWVKTELLEAFEQERREGRRKLFPIGLVPFSVIRAWKCFDSDSGKDLARYVREYFIPDFSEWRDHDTFEQAFSRLLRDLRRLDESLSPA